MQTRPIPFRLAHRQDRQRKPQEPAMPATAIAPSLPATGITDAQVRSFVTDGFLVVPGLVAPDEIAAIRSDAAHLARGGYPCPQITPMPATLSDDEVLRRLLCIHQPHAISPVMRGFVEHRGIAAVLARIVGAHLPTGWWDGSVKCMQSMLFVKPPGKPGQAWHQDEMYIPTRDRSLCGAWIAVDDATIENGCLWIIPGSHRPGYLYPNRPPADLGEYDGSPQCFGFDESLAVPVEVKAGSVVFFNGYVLHKSLRNRSGTYRRALVNHFMTGQSLLPWGFEGSIEPGALLAQLDNRCVIPVAGTDPYAWKGYLEHPRSVHLRSFHEAAPAP
jgi:phytanoyl-CoA hydroxylase